MKQNEEDGATSLAVTISYVLSYCINAKKWIELFWGKTYCDCDCAICFLYLGPNYILELKTTSNTFEDNFFSVIFSVDESLSESIGVAYESIWRKEHIITELISSQQPQGPSMETWIKGSVQWLFIFLSLFLRHQVAKAFITSAATATLLPADGEWTSTKKKEEAVIKDRGTGTISGWRPHPGPPVKEHALLLRICVVCSAHTCEHSLPPLFHVLSVLECTQGTSTNIIVVEDHAGCQRQSPFPWTTILIKNIHSLRCGIPLPMYWSST